MAESTLTIRRPAVAGTFYPSRPERLQIEVDRLLSEAQAGRSAASTGAHRTARRVSLLRPDRGQRVPPTSELATRRPANRLSSSDPPTTSS